MTRSTVTIALLSLLPVFALAAPVTGEKQLVCGGAVLRAVSSYDADAGPDVIWTSQSLTLAQNGQSRPLPLETGSKQGDGGLEAIVSAWGCFHGHGRAYILLDYACTRDDFGGICAGQQEWSRLLSPDGKRLDAGYAPQDPRYMALYAKLGFGPQGLQLTGATP
jgi:hypothetical protein